MKRKLEKYVSSGTSLDGKSALPTIEPSTTECQLIHSYVRENFLNLIETHCPKV